MNEYLTNRWRCSLMGVNYYIFLSISVRIILNQLQRMNHNSFMEDEEQLQSHCLGLQFGAENIGDWRGNSQERVQTPSQTQIDYFSQFNINQNMINEVIQSFSKQNQCTQIIQSLTPVKDQKNAEIDRQNSVQKVDTSQAETFYQNSSMNTTILRDSILQQNYQSENKIILNDFFSLYKYNYDPLMNNFGKMLQKIQNYSNQSIANLDMYCLFFRIKFEQQFARHQQLKQHIYKTKQQIINNQLLEKVYLEENVIVQQMQIVIEEKIIKIDSYCEQLMQISNKFKIILEKAIHNRKSKLEQLHQQLQRTKRIQRQLIQSINQMPKPQSSNKENTINVNNIKSDRYLQRKYLVERQKLFLQLIKKLGEKMVHLLSSIFIKEEPIICAVINRQMIRYKKISQLLYGKSKQKEGLSKINHAQMMNDLSEILYEIIPHQWLGTFVVSSQRNSELILYHFNQFIQGQLYLPSFQINQEHILFSSTAKWQPKNSQQSNFISSKPTQNNVQNLDNIQLQGTYKNLISNRLPQKRLEFMNVNIVLTLDKFLHLQCGEKIATLKLKKLKLTKKNNCILVYEKSKGLVALFGQSLHFGTIIFQRQQEANLLIQAVSSAG